MGSQLDPVATVAMPSVCLNLPLMLVVMAIEAKEFPIAAIGRIVVVIMVTMVNRQFAQVGMRKFPGTATTDPRIKLEGPLTIALFSFVTRFSRRKNHLVKTVAHQRTNSSIDNLSKPFATRLLDGGRYWDRTSDPCRVKAVLYR